MLSSTANGQSQSQQEYKTAVCERRTSKKQKETIKQKRVDEFRLLTFKQEFLEISVSLQIEFAVQTHLAEGQVARRASKHGGVMNVLSRSL